jgi:hypothetical protein
MFSSVSLSSISFATVTPSLVMVGEPNFFVDHDVAALGAQGDLYGVSEYVDTAKNRLAGLFSVYDLFCHFSFLLKLIAVARCENVLRDIPN